MPARCTPWWIATGTTRPIASSSIASGLDQPNGVAMRNGALYVATASRLLRFDDIEKHLDAPPAPVTVRDDLPNPKAGHTWKFIAFGPDDMLYMSVGAPCNVCRRRRWWRPSCG